MENDKNCTTNHVWGQNQLILSLFASLSSLRSFGTTKSDKVLNEIFLGRTNGKHEPQIMFGGFGGKKPTHFGLVCKFGKYGRFWYYKKNKVLTEIFLGRTDGKPAPHIIFRGFGRKTNSGEKVLTEIFLGRIDIKR